MLAEIEKAKSLIECIYFEPGEQLDCCGVIIGNLPFSDQYQDDELKKKLTQMRGRQTERDKIYEKLAEILPDEQSLIRFVSIIQYGFVAIAHDIWYRQDRFDLHNYNVKKKQYSKLLENNYYFTIPKDPPIRDWF